MQPTIPPLTLVSAFSKLLHILFLTFGPAQKILLKLLSEIMQGSPVTMSPWSLSTYYDLLQMHVRLSGVSKLHQY